jgi:hypothetical protein
MTQSWCGVCDRNHLKHISRTEIAHIPCLPYNIKIHLTRLPKAHGDGLRFMRAGDLERYKEQWTQD